MVPEHTRKADNTVQRYRQSLDTTHLHRLNIILHHISALCAFFELFQACSSGQAVLFGDKPPSAGLSFGVWETNVTEKEEDPVEVSGIHVWF